MKLVSSHYLLVIVISLLSITSCSSNIPSHSYPHTTKSTPTKYRPAVSTKPKPRPIKKPIRVKTPIKKPVIKTVIKAPKVKIRTYQPEQGKNPYNDVPTSSHKPTPSASSDNQKNSRHIGRSRSDNTPSPAVKSLLLQAKAAMILKRNASAIEKLERALRIEPHNPNIWHQLAKAHFNQKEDASAISMAQKSNLYVDEESSLEKQNWKVIKAASKRSEDIKSLKAAIQYERANP